MKHLALLALLGCSLAGCLDSIVDDPCEDGYSLDDSGTCVAHSGSPDLTMPPLPPEQVSPPADPTMTTPEPVEPTLHTPPPYDPTITEPGEPSWHGDWFCWYGCK